MDEIFLVLEQGRRSSTALELSGFSVVMLRDVPRLRNVCRVMEGASLPISRLASFRGGAKNDDVRSLAARLYHVTTSENGSGVAVRFNSVTNPSGFIQDVGCW